MKLEVESNGIDMRGMFHGAAPGFRIREAAKDQVPLEQMLAQLREIIVGPTERVSEARLDEMLDILGDLKGTHDRQIGTINSRVETIAGKAEHLNNGLNNLNNMLGTLEVRLSDNSKHLREVFIEAVDQSHNDLEKQIQAVPVMMRSALAELEAKLRRSLGELSSALSTHIVDDEVARKQDRDLSMSSLEQRIAQWRAEIDDSRRDDMHEVATSMMDIGQRLMALRQM